MPKYDRYHPDYGRLYPEIQARPDVLSVLKKSDRKMEYMEVDIKQERFSYVKSLTFYPVGRIPMTGSLRRSITNLPWMNHRRKTCCFKRRNCICCGPHCFCSPQRRKN